MTVMNHSASYLIHMDDFSFFFLKHLRGERGNSFLTTLPDLGVGAMRIFPSLCLFETKQMLRAL